jgi:hypothetical protein
MDSVKRWRMSKSLLAYSALRLLLLLGRPSPLPKSQLAPTWSSACPHV